LTTQEEILTHRALVVHISTQSNGIWRVHGAAIVDGVAEQQTMWDVDVLLTYPENLALDHRKTAVVILLSTKTKRGT
jgi:hypothetical protein